MGSLNQMLLICRYNKLGDLLPGQATCYNLDPVFSWIERCIISIFLVFMIAFLPLFLQGGSLASYVIFIFSADSPSPLAELTERGTGRALYRLGKHFLSLSPVFEVFSTQIYTHSILSNLTFGGARYIATGRGFATTRINFSTLYSRFAGPSVYLGLRLGLMMLYVTMTLWMNWFIYFWVTTLALSISPFLFNPHQFSFAEFIIDYREFLRWMSRGNSRSHGNSWVGYCRLSRTRVTGYKRKRLGHPSEKLASDVPRAGWRTVLQSEIVGPVFMAVILTLPYLFVKS
jgi:1,3-beta-glucan synthase